MESFINGCRYFIFMLDYFRESQRVREEIEADGNLTDRISSVLTFSKGDLIGDGLHNKAYRIGQTESGLFVALRVPISEVDMSMYEGFCQMAAMRANEYDRGVKQEVLWSRTGLPIRPVKFCIGVFQNDKPGIITEDVTENGKYTIESYACREEVRRFDQEGNSDYVLIDLDNLNDARIMDRLAQHCWEETQPEELERPKYFAEANRLHV